MANGSLPTPDELRKLLSYDPVSGILTWRADDGRHAALSMAHPKGYLFGVIRGRTVLAHRAAWAIHHGSWPRNQIDHINGVRTDNRIENLRDVTAFENMRNQKRREDNASGVTGVSWDARRRKWRATIGSRGTYKSLGSFETIEEAARVRAMAEKGLCYHENHGRR